MRTLSVETTIHGRVLIEEATSTAATGSLIVFHGYGQAAEVALADVRAIPGADCWMIASVQGLHRFYTRGDQRVIASWMTRQDRDEAIRDNVAYVDRVIDAVHASGPIVFAGFSQGAAMAYRAARLGAHRAAGILALGGDIPPELKVSDDRNRWPPVLIGAGDHDTWYTATKVDADAAFLASSGAAPDVVRFPAGHEWTDAFRAAAGQWLQRLIQAAATSRA
jgi:predicted esterase